MGDTLERTEDLLADKPQMESALSEILSVEAAQGPGWAFDDIAVDSGEFGELVSEGIVVKTGDTYRLADPESVRIAIGDETTSDRQPSSEKSVFDRLNFGEMNVSRDIAGVIVAALVLTIIIRSWMFSDVFRPEMVVLGGNDSYGYRYWIETLLETRQAFDLEALSDLPRDVGKKDVLYVVMIWWTAALLGGTPEVSRAVLAIYPLVSAVLTGLAVYWLALKLTSDRRVGIGAMLFFAVTPVHAYRVMLGFADHHPFDYIWMVATVVGLVGIVSDEWEQSGGHTSSALLARLTNRQTVGFTLLFAVGVAGNLLAWRGGPLYLVPVGIFFAVLPLLQFRHGISPILANTPLFVGMSVASVLTTVPHIAFGWAVPYRAYLPLALFAGVLAVVILTEVGQRQSLSARTVGVGIAVFSVLSISIALLFVPWLAEIWQRAVTLFETKGIAENASLFSANMGSVFAPVFLFGFILFLALPPVTVAVRRVYQSYRPALLVLVVYFWAFFVLSVVRIRFGGQLTVFTSVFAGVGFLWLAEWVDLTASATFDLTQEVAPQKISLPDLKTAGSLIILFLLILNFGLVQIPIKQGQITIGDTQYETARWMNEYADERGWDYPESYVFSQWGRNRVFNYVVHGRTPNSRFAKLNYAEFLASTESDRWYERLRNRVGFILTEDGMDIGAGSMYDRLHNHRTSSAQRVAGLSHYRYVYQSDSGRFRVYTLVPGAIISGKGQPNSTVKVHTDVSIGEETFVYERQVRTTMTGRYALTVPYPGTYENIDTETVTEADITSGEFINEQRDVGNWSLEAGRGEYVFDSAGGNHGIVTNGTWVKGRDGRGLAFSGDGHVTIRDPPELGESGFTYSIWFRTDQNVDYVNERTGTRLLAQTSKTPYRETNGVQLHLLTGNLTATVGNGTQTGIARGPRVDDGEWHKATVSWNGTRLYLYLDGDIVGTATFEGSLDSEAPLVFGASSEHQREFLGKIDKVSYFTEYRHPDLAADDT